MGEGEIDDFRFPIGRALEEGETLDVIGGRLRHPWWVFRGSLALRRDVAATCAARVFFFFFVINHQFSTINLLPEPQRRGGL